MAVRGWAPELADFPTAVGSAFTAGRGRSRASLAGLTRQVADHAHLEDAAKEDLLAALKVITAFSCPSQCLSRHGCFRVAREMVLQCTGQCTCGRALVVSGGRRVSWLLLLLL